MARPFVLPVTAAVVGALMAVGITALNKAGDRGHFTVEVGDASVRAAEVRVEARIIRDVVDEVRREIRMAVEAERELTESERAKLRQAMKQLDATLAADLDLSGMLEGLEALEALKGLESLEALEGLEDLEAVEVEVITAEDGAVHRDAVPEGADAPAAPTAPTGPGGN